MTRKLIRISLVFGVGMGINTIIVFDWHGMHERLIAWGAGCNGIRLCKLSVCQCVDQADICWSKQDGMDSMTRAMAAQHV